MSSVERLARDAARDRRVVAEPTPASRRIVTAALSAGRKSPAVYALTEVDVTVPLDLLSRPHQRGSFTAFMVAATARAAARHPAVHQYRDWRGRTITHSHVDVNTIVETELAGEKFPMATIVRDADLRSVESIYDEIKSYRRDPSLATTRAQLMSFAVASRVPGAASVVFRLMGRSLRARRRVGTLSVTSLSMFGRDGGFAVPAPTLYTATVALGGLSRKPRVVDEVVVIRDVLDLTVMFDHRMVDGAPAARFLTDVRQIVESGTPLLP